jgi:transposase InsO family protein
LHFSLEGKMPFVERDIMALREDFVQSALLEGANISALCRTYGISRKTGYKWLDRYGKAVAGEAWSGDHSRRPQTSPGRTKPEIEAAALAVRAAHPAWGGRKIRHILLAQQQDKRHTVPTASTVTAILARHGQISEAASRAATPFVRFEHDEPNQLWQMDFKGHFALSCGRCHPLTVLDDHSRFNLCLAACANEQTATVKSHLISTFRCYGLPDRIIMDNGPPWGNGAGLRWTPLTVWLLMLSVAVSHGRPYHPQTQGKDERFHRTLKAEVLSRSQFDTLDQCQTRFDAWRLLYNTIRPHQAIDMAVPASRYTPGLRPFPEDLRPPEYGQDDIIRRVVDPGYVSYRGNSLNVPKAFIGFKVALRSNHSEPYKLDVCFGTHVIKTIDLTTEQA